MCWKGQRLQNYSTVQKATIKFFFLKQHYNGHINLFLSLILEQLQNIQNTVEVFHKDYS